MLGGICTLKHFLVLLWVVGFFIGQEVLGEYIILKFDSDDDRSMVVLVMIAALVISLLAMILVFQWKWLIDQLETDERINDARVTCIALSGSIVAMIITQAYKRYGSDDPWDVINYQAWITLSILILYIIIKWVPQFIQRYYRYQPVTVDIVR